MTKPKMPIRRFDVFAEFTKQKAMQDGMPEDEAEGYGLWVAKVVASRRYGGGSLTQPPRKGTSQEDPDDKDEEPKPKWHELGEEPQTDRLFEEEVVSRMGRQFYNTVFAPAIEDALAQGKSYPAIRDTIRKDWKP